MCASKCFLKIGKYDDAKDAFDKSKEFVLSSVSVTRPIVIIDDSKAIAMKLQNYVEKLGYSDIFSYENGKNSKQNEATQPHSQDKSKLIGHTKPPTHRNSLKSFFSKNIK